jgi:phosphonate transport system ATP-binding protein
MGYLATAAAERDLTTITSLHQVNIAREFGERFIGLRDGAVVFDGAESELTTDVVKNIYYDDVEGTESIDRANMSSETSGPVLGASEGG